MIGKEHAGFVWRQEVYDLGTAGKKEKIEQRQVRCENGDISYFLTRKSVKNVNLRIKPDGRVLVSANNRVPIEFIEGFIKQKQTYILSALAKYEEKRKSVQNIPKKYVTGEIFGLLGKNYTLKVEEATEELVHTDGAFIILRVKDPKNFRHKERMLSKWLKEYQISVFQQVIQETYSLFIQREAFHYTGYPNGDTASQTYEVPYPILKVRRMKARWGSCQPQKGIITLNSLLIAAPKACIEYVVVHEFAHFIHPNHSRQFWDLVTRMMPDWKERKEELDKRF